jgi:hypothetical protein
VVNFIAAAKAAFGRSDFDVSLHRLAHQDCFNSGKDEQDKHRQH